jgi:hypothetical protein
MAVYEKYNVWNEEQSLFATTLRGLWWFIKLTFKLLVYLPLIFTGYLIATKFLDPKANGILWIGTTLLIACALYLFMYFLKGIILVLKFHRNLLWLPLLMIAVSFTCILPIWLAWDAATTIISDIRGNIIMQWIFAIAFGAYIYLRYNFLTNIAPSFAFPAYDAGIHFAAMILKNASLVRAAKSKEVS